MEFHWRLVPYVFLTLGFGGELTKVARAARHVSNQPNVLTVPLTIGPVGHMSHKSPKRRPVFRMKGLNQATLWLGDLYPSNITHSHHWRAELLKELLKSGLDTFPPMHR